MVRANRQMALRSFIRQPAMLDASGNSGCSERPLIASRLSRWLGAGRRSLPPPRRRLDHRNAPLAAFPPRP